MRPESGHNIKMQRGPKIEVASSSDYVRNVEDDEVMGARGRPRSEEYARDASVKRNIGVIHVAMRTRSKMAIAVGSLAAVLFLAVVVTAIVTTVLVTKKEKEKLKGEIHEAKTELKEMLKDLKSNVDEDFAKKNKLNKLAKKGKVLN